MTARVDVAEGYVLTHKFDNISKERPLLEVVSVFNELCLLIREKRTVQDLQDIANNLAEVFRTDFPMLAQLLPNIHVLSADQQKPPTNAGESGVRMDLRSIGFVLQRFLRVVASKANPVMVFLGAFLVVAVTLVKL